MRTKMAAKIVRTTKKAIDVFSSENVTNERLQELITLTSQLTAKDINLDLSRVRRPRSRAPVSYMDIFGNSTLTVCVFVLWEGSKMPMHNHPDMYGILKVLHGKVRVQSYSVMPVNNNGVLDGSSVENGWMPDTVSKILSQDPKLVLARKHRPLDVVAGENNPPAVLQPNEFNIHAIEAVDGPAAFLDILAPPYHEHERDCEYFEEANSLTPNVEEPFVFLQPYEPKNFWSDKAEYLGPPVRL